MLSLIINTVYAADDVDRIIGNISKNIITPIIAVMFGLAFVVFLYGVLEFIQGGSNEKSVEIGKRHMIYGILGLTIIIGTRGIINLITGIVNSL